MLFLLFHLMESKVTLAYVPVLFISIEWQYKASPNYDWIMVAVCDVVFVYFVILWGCLDLSAICLFVVLYFTVIIVYLRQGHLKCLEKRILFFLMRLFIIRGLFLILRRRVCGYYIIFIIIRVLQMLFVLLKNTLQWRKLSLLDHLIIWNLFIPSWHVHLIFKISWRTANKFT